MDYLLYRTTQVLGRYLRSQRKMPHRYRVRVLMERRDPHVKWPEIRLTPSGEPFALLQLLKNDEVKESYRLTATEWYGLNADADNWDSSISTEGTRTVLRPTELLTQTQTTN